MTEKIFSKKIGCQEMYMHMLKKKRNRNICVVGILALLSSAATNASSIDPLSGFTSALLPVCDDCYSGAISLGFTANFFGLSYTSTYVSNNGYITFGSGQGSFTPTGLTSAYSGNPIIAPFFADVDTRGIGTVSYGTGTYNGDSAFAVTWNNVGYYSSQINKTDTFQMLMVDRSDVGVGDFDIIFNYGQIQWETGGASGGSNGLGGISAAVGFANGTGAAGTYVQLAGSLAPGSFLDAGTSSLINGTNDGTSGQYLFQVRAGEIINPPLATVPVPAAAWLFGSGLFGLIGVARRKK